MKDILLERRSKAQNAFDELQKSKEAKQREIEEIDVEMARLQGEYRVINELIESTGPRAKVSKKANVIDATEVEGA